VAGYAYAVRDNDVYVNLYLNSRASIQTEAGELLLSQKSVYPWKGDVLLEVQNEKEVETRLFLRIPGWARNEALPSDLFSFKNPGEKRIAILVNGEEVNVRKEKGYVILSEKWKKGDRINLVLPMEDRIVEANEKVKAKKGLLAVQYGPLVYCAEEIDNRQDVLEAELSENSVFQAKFNPELLGGLNVLKGEDLELLPYYAWANRGAGKMNVWFNEK